MSYRDVRLDNPTMLNWWRTLNELIVGTVIAKKFGPIESVLEVGGGYGDRAPVIADALGCSVLCTDKHWGHLRDAPEIDMVKYQQADATALPFGDKGFDLVLAVGLFSGTALPVESMSEIQRVARRAIIIIDGQGYAQKAMAALPSLDSLPIRIPNQIGDDFHIMWKVF